MRMIFFMVVAVAFLIVFITSMIVATPVLGPEVYIYFKGASDGVVKSVTMPGYSGGVYAGLYQFKVDSIKPYNESEANTWYSYCFDPWTLIYAGQNWMGYYNSPYNIGTGVGILFPANGGHSESDAEAIQKYNMIGYLAHKYFYNSDPAVSAPGDRANLSLVLWEIAVDYREDVLSSLNLGIGSFRTSSGYGNATSWLTDAYGYRNSGPFPYAYSGIGQETFAPIPIPEPDNFIMLFFGLVSIAVIGYCRRRFKK